MQIIPEFLEEYSQEIVNMVTIGQYESISNMYNSWLSNTVVPEPNILSFIFAFFFVLLKFAVPAVLLYFFVLKYLTKNHYIRFILVAIITMIYSIVYINPIEIFGKFAEGINNFYYFLMALPSLDFQPLFFTFLTNGVPIFILKALVCFIGIFVFFSALLGIGTLLFIVATSGDTPWKYTDKEFIPYSIRLSIVFLMIYPLFGAFKTFLTVLALVIGSVEFTEIFYKMRGYQKHCWTEAGQVICKWGK